MTYGEWSQGLYSCSDTLEGAGGDIRRQWHVLLGIDTINSATYVLVNLRGWGRDIIL